MTVRLGILLAFTTAACASSGTPAPETVSRVGISGAAGGMGRAELHNAPGTGSRTVPAPLDSVWHVLPRVYEILGVPQAGAVSDQRLFGAYDFRPRRIEGKRLSTYLDCGMGLTATPKADEYEVTMSLLTRLTPAGGGGTVAETLVDASAKPRGVTGNPVYCQSNGVLETRVAELLLWVLVSGR